VGLEGRGTGVVDLIQFDSLCKSLNRELVIDPCVMKSSHFAQLCLQEASVILLNYIYSRIKLKLL
jgi:hypothetical protein